MAQYRKDQLVNDECYHVYTRSIAKFVIFNNDQEYSRMLELIDLIKYASFEYQFSQFKRKSIKKQSQIIRNLRAKDESLVDIVAYCLMPTHIHLLIKQNKNDGIVKYLAKILNSYSKYFNTKHKRSGPLWSGRFKSVRVGDDEQLLHLTRYTHLNPVSAGLIKKADDWNFSSHKEYINKAKSNICKFDKVLDINSSWYEKFVNDHKDYQRQISYIKRFVFDEYSG